jgi:hypothetical protein
MDDNLKGTMPFAMFAKNKQPVRNKSRPSFVHYELASYVGLE